MATRTTTRRTPGFRCGECGWTTAKWVGRCGECQAWGTVAETGAPTAARTTAASVVTPALRIADVDVTRAAARPTGVAEFDRVLGGGLVPGGVVLVAGEPGVGKSTLLLDVAARAARSGSEVLYISGEESAAQVRTRAERRPTPGRRQRTRHGRNAAFPSFLHAPVHLFSDRPRHCLPWKCMYGLFALN